MIDEDEDFESTDGDAAPLTRNVDRRYAGTRALWMKVIIRAVFDWVTYKDNTKIDKRKYAESAYEWLFKQNYLFNSFENICRNLDIDPERIRTQALKMTKDDVAKIEHLERDYEAEEDGCEEPEPVALPVRVSRNTTSLRVARVSDGVF